MRNGPQSRIAVAVGAIVLIVSAIAGVVLLINGQRGFAACSGVAGTGWIVPILAGLLIGSILWLLSSEDPRLDDHGTDGSASTTPCPECGERVLADWRLCPSCGTRLQDTAGVS